MVLLMARPNKTTMIQKDFFAKTHFAAGSPGGSPGKCPHRLNRANITPIKIAISPITLGTTRQENQIISISEMIGAATKARFGAIS